MATETFSAAATCGASLALWPVGLTLERAVGNVRLRVSCLGFRVYLRFRFLRFRV